VKTDEIKQIWDNYYPVLRENRKWIGIGALVMAILMLILAATSTVYYTSRAVFHPEMPDQSLAASPVSVLMGGGPASTPNADITGVLLSRTLSEMVAEDSTRFRGEKVLLGDLIIDNNPVPLIPLILSLFRSTPDSVSLNSKVITAGSILRRLLLVETDENGYMVMEIRFVDKQIVKQISLTYIEKLEKYYNYQKTLKAQKNLEFYNHRTDSVGKVWQGNNIDLARFYDENRFRILKADEVPSKEMEARQTMLTQMYRTLMESKEQAVSQLVRDTPIIQILDPPLPPYRREAPSKIIYFILGLILGSLGASAWFTRSMLKVDLLNLIKRTLDGDS
jgi:uncharacterized protein involved in exopolysaccharide biosynthesis